MTIGTIFTLFVLPSLYILLAKDHTKERAQSATAAEPALATSVTLAK
jgi:multidrug efflux pump